MPQEVGQRFGRRTELVLGTSGGDNRPRERCDVNRPKERPGSVSLHHDFLIVGDECILVIRLFRHVRPVSRRGPAGEEGVGRPCLRRNATLRGSGPSVPRRSASCTGRRALIRWRNASLKGSCASLPRTNASLKGSSALLRWRNAFLKGSRASLPRMNAVLKGSHASLPRMNAFLKGSRASLPRTNASLKGSAPLPRTNAFLKGSRASLPRTNAFFARSKAPLFRHLRASSKKRARLVAKSAFFASSLYLGGRRQGNGAAPGDVSSLE